MDCSEGVGGVVEMSEYKANLGQPIYIDGMFVGSEFPETDTQIESGLGHVRYYTGKNFTDFERDGQLTEDGKYISWQTVVGASHSDGSDQESSKVIFMIISTVLQLRQISVCSTTPGSTT